MRGKSVLFKGRCSGIFSRKPAPSAHSWAAAGGHTEIAKLLIAAGCRKNKISRQRVTPLELAKYKQKRIQDNINHLGEEFTDAVEKTKLLKK
jgi:hypothetical protein